MYKVHPLLGWGALLGSSLFAQLAFANLEVDFGCQYRSFELTLTWDKHAPDGFERDMALVNGQFPGPLLELDEGDVVEVLVHNKMPYNTTLHFHGIEMIDTPWADGMPGLTQRQIRTGGSFLYKWKATQYGSYWYHSHQRGQIDDGLYGPIVIHPKNDRPRPFNLISTDPATIEAMIRAEQRVKPLVVSDFRHVTSEFGWNVEVAAGIETPCYDSVLFNGKGSVQCWSQAKMDSLMNAVQEEYLALGNETQLTAKGCLSANIIANVLSTGASTNVSAVPSQIFDVCTPTSGSTEIIEVRKPPCAPVQWIALDVIGTFGLVTGSFSIDSHPVYVYAVDGSYIEPQLVDAITVTNGDRYSVLVKIDTPGNYTIRMASTAAAQMLAGYGVLSVIDDTSTLSPSSEAYINDVGLNTTAGVVFFDQSAMKAYPPDIVSPTANATFKMEIQVTGNGYNWALNRTIYPMEMDNDYPLLFHPTPYIHNNVTITTSYGDWVDLIFMTATFPMPPHPIHKHSTKMWLIGSGTGDFNYSSVSEAMEYIPESFNIIDPPKRDTIATPVATTDRVWMAIRYHVTNPGAWLLHCHIQSHQLGGMVMAIQDGIDQWPSIPAEYLNYY